jgi:hypothetical protein
VNLPGTGDKQQEQAGQQYPLDESQAYIPVLVQLKFIVALN